MSFKSLNHILGALENQAGWQGLQEFRRLQECWSGVVPQAAMSHTRPVSISRGVLWVATSSSAWAQTLSFQRHSMLKKLNAQLSSPLVDIRFSTAQWQNDSRSSNSFDSDPESLFCSEHPSHVVDAGFLPTASNTPARKDPHLAFQNWAEAVQRRSQLLPLCPQCQCPTPVGELQRWDVCALCAAKQKH